MALYRVLRLVSFPVLAFLLLASNLWADSQARIVRLSYVQGDVQIDRGEGQELAVLNTPVQQGMTVSAPDESRAEIEFENGSTIRLADYSQVVFEELALRSSGGKINTVRVDSGTVYFRFRDVDDDDDIRVVCAGVTFRVGKSSRFRVDIAGGAATVAVFGGKVEMEGAQESVEIKKGNTLRLDLGEQVTYAKERGTESLSSDEWEQDREREYSEYARGDQGYDGYGASDLNRYGNYIHVDGYGYVWRPSGMSLDWDPFGNGIWTSYAGCGGYTWVSPYAWGWAPYRFGRWVWVNGIGWVWWPGARYTWSSYYNWNCGPTFHGYIPPTYIVPVVPTRDPRPRHGSRPPRVVVVGDPPNVPRRWTPPGRPFSGGTTNTAGGPDPRVDKKSPIADAPTNRRPARDLADDDVFVRDKGMQVTPVKPLEGRTTNAPGTVGTRPARPAGDAGRADSPVRRTEAPRAVQPVQPRNSQKIEPVERGDDVRPTRPASTNVAPQPRPAPQPKADSPARSTPPSRVDAPSRSAPAPSRVDSPARSAPAPARVDSPARSAPAPSTPAPRSSGGDTGRSGGGHSSPPPSGGHKR